MGTPLPSSVPLPPPRDPAVRQLWVVDAQPPERPPPRLVALEGGQREAAPGETAPGARDRTVTLERVEMVLPQRRFPPLSYRMIGTVAVFAFEVVEGARHVGQLGRWISEPVAASLSELRSLNLERRSLYRDQRVVVPSVLRVRASQPAPRVTEAAVILATKSRSRAVALRFESGRGRWQATAITVL